jgi:ABC-2 type transport system ATP-binding protein
MTAIECSGVTKRFGEDVLAVDDLDLTVEEGEIYGFLGPNGAGKTTTIDMLLDFVRPTSGTVEVLGRSAQDETVDIHQDIGVLPEGFGLYHRLTGRQHVEFAIDSKRVNATESADALLERVGLGDAADRKAGEYSSGMSQRLGLAMALVGEPELLILDEPTSGLDPNGARELRGIVREEIERGATVFFSSHILGQVEAVCDRVGILRDGRMVAEDSIEDLRATVDVGAKLTVTVDDVTEDLADTVRVLEGVEAVHVDGNDIVVTADDEAKTTVITAIEDAGATVENFRTVEASLEDLFAAYTTEQGRDTDGGDEVTA